MKLAALSRRLLLRADRLIADLGESLDGDRRRLDAGFESCRSRFYKELWAEVAERAGARIDDLGDDFMAMTRSRRTVFVRRYQVMLDNPVSLQLAGNKPVSAALLAEQGITQLPQAVSFNALDPEPARNLLNTGPLVIKPASGTGGGRGVVSQVRNQRQLARAVRHAARVSLRLVAEAQVPGHSYRLLYLNGELIDAVRRDPPRVVGDGVANLRDLVSRENQRRLSGEITALSPLEVDLDARLWLAGQGLSPASCPAAGQSVQLKHVCNQNRDLENHDVRDQVCQEIEDLGRRAGALLGLELCGVDLMAPGLDRPLQETGGIINEVNSTPGLHHHFLVKGRDRETEVADRVLDAMFERARPGEWT